jgi:hypothetical protein
MPTTPVPVRSLPPAVHPAFLPGGSPPGLAQPTQEDLEGLDLPETYLLYHGPGDEPALRLVLDAWSWAAASIGEYYPLVLAGLDNPAQDRLAALLAEYQLTGRPPPLSYRSGGCLSQLSCPVPTRRRSRGATMPDGAGLQQPLVGLETGRAPGRLSWISGFPVEPYPATCRALGAALITVVVEDSLADTLSQAARGRAAAWRFDLFSSSLREQYRALARGADPAG